MIAIEAATRAVTAESNLLMGVVLVREEGEALQSGARVAALRAATHYRNKIYSFKKEVKIIFSVFVQICPLAVYVF